MEAVELATEIQEQEPPDHDPAAEEVVASETDLAAAAAASAVLAGQVSEPLWPFLRPVVEAVAGMLMMAGPKKFETAVTAAAAWVDVDSKHEDLVLHLPMADAAAAAVQVAVGHFAALPAAHIDVA